MIEERNSFEEGQIKNEKKILTLSEAAKFLQLSKSCIYKLTSKKKIAHFVPGGKKIYFKKSDLENWVFENRVTPTTEFENSTENYLSRTSKTEKPC